MSQSIWKTGQRVRVAAHVDDAAGLTGTVAPTNFSTRLAATSVFLDGDFGIPGIPAFFFDTELEALEELEPAEAGK
ncbi:hypothetical protein [Streptomyces sp. NPDC001422]|uniref:hypothetical protein n=1 Tax=Streptomyces sp. NPDC001422 TaxID=3364575 RepID=UPI0036A37237